MLDLIRNEGGRVAAKLLEHLNLTAIAILVGLLIAFPLAVYAFRHRRVYAPIAGVTGLLYTIPSLALFAFLTPYTGLSMLTAEIGLVSYTLLILIRNIVAGLDSVPADAREAARGMGLSERELLWRVEVPLALPVIFAGIRLATVTVVGLVTVTSLITYGGVGAFILEGIVRLDASRAAFGGLLSLLIALVLDAVLLAAERRVAPWSTRRSERTA
ncbi:MAG TPA: ABC transporter permease [Actinomycetota bacterium]|jgi:osmoprotectant transport system permease protein|nr:ABC transporter permease [Actinomycetota bacterium]